MPIKHQSPLALTCTVFLGVFLGVVLGGISTTVVAEDEPKKVISIPAKNGRVEWNDVWREVSRQVGVDLDFSLPSEGEINLNSRAARLTIIGLNLAMRGDVHLATDRKRGMLIVSLNRAALQKKQAKYGRQIRKLGISSEDEEMLGLQLRGDQLDRNEPIERLVVLTHGFSSSPSTTRALQESLDEDGRVTASFGYHSRLGVVDAATALSHDLRRLQEQHPDTKVTIVAHSMGGIVARWMVEHPDLYPANVDQLIMVTPPNHGSDLTRPGLSGPPIHLKNVRVDPVRIGELAGGVAEEVNLAIRDLRPGSFILQQLNEQRRNPNVSYSIILGNEAIVDPILISLTQQLLVERQKNAIVFAALEQIESFEGQMDELLKGRGDGVVSLRSGQLDGVSDLIVLPIRHNDVGRKERPAFQTIQREVSKRIPK